MTRHLSWNLRQKLKLIALIVLFAGPLITAWAMVEWRVGIPDERVAHGQLMPELPALAQWPLAQGGSGLDKESRDDWILAYDCQGECAEIADHLWRLHRALGREAPRVSRLRLGGQADPLPGEQVAQWRRQPAWSDGKSVWLIDSEGRVVVRYDQQDDPAEILKDIRRLLRMNPEVERLSASTSVSARGVIREPVYELAS